MSSSRKTILIVDDDRIISMAESAFLCKNGYRTIVAGSGDEVIEILDNGQKFDLVLMDIELGSGICGAELAERISEAGNIPIIFLSSHDEEAVADRIRGVKQYGYVMKDSGEYELLAAVKTAIGVQCGVSESAETG